VVAAIILVGAIATVSAFALKHKQTDAKPLSAVRIAIVGDSYSAGMRNRVVWPTLLAQRTGWSISNFALPDAGYAADGLGGGHGFTYQVERAQGANPQYIVVVSGIADQQFVGTGDITTGATIAINKIKLGGQQALVIGPTWYDTPVPQEVRNVSDEIRKVADTAGVPFLDALDPPWLKPDQMQADLGSPTDGGQSVIADKIAAWLRTQVAR